MSEATDTPPPDTGFDRIEAFGDHLVQIHNWLRQELSTVRSGVEEFLDGRAATPTGPSTPPDLGLELRKHCLAFCDGLHSHHAGEDSLLFPVLEQDFPQLAPALEKLREDHRTLARIIQEFESVVSELTTADPERVRTDLNRLSDQLEAHLAREESELVAAMNTMPQAQVDELIAAAQASAAAEENG